MIVVSFATEDGTFDRYLARLRRSCEVHGIAHDLRIIPPRPAIDAFRYKPTFILEMVRKHNDTVLWIDADAVFLKSFKLEGHWDIGLIPNNNARWKKIYPMAAFVVAAAPTDGAVRFLETWERLCQMPSDHFDHSLLMIARQLETKYKEGNILPQLDRALVRDYGLSKEVPVLSNPIQAFAHRVVRAIERRVRRKQR